MNQLECNNFALDNLVTELSLIKELEVRNFTTEMILRTPGLFWYRPSAFFKGHHPDDEIGSWGNLIHVKRVLVVAKEFVGIEDLTTQDADTLYSGLALHDIGKYGPEGTEERILKDHPEISMNIVLARLERELTDREDLILSVILTHMGRWGKFKPTKPLEKLGHYCDCLGSRITVNIPIKLKEFKS